MKNSVETTLHLFYLHSNHSEPTYSINVNIHAKGCLPETCVMLSEGLDADAHVDTCHYICKIFTLRVNSTF